MSLRAKFAARSAALVAAAVGLQFSPAMAQEQGFVQPIQARARVFRETGPGVTSIKRGAAGLHYVLATPANVITIYGADDKRVGQIPNANSHGAKIIFAQDFDIDASGRLFVADRGADAVKVFKADGSLEATIAVPAPSSIVALSGDEFAVTSLRSDRLVSVYGLKGKLIRGFGNPEGAPEPESTAAALNPSRLFGDPAGHIFLAFTGTPDPVIRRYDRFGFASYEITLPSEWFTGPAEGRRWDSVTIEKGGEVSKEKPDIGALAVDTEREQLWAAVADELIWFDKDGNRRASYRTATPEGARIEGHAILVEPNRILIAADPIGVFEFARPDGMEPVSTQH